MLDMSLSDRDRLLQAVAQVRTTAPPRDAALWSVPLTEPDAVRVALVDLVGDERMVVVTGTLDRRLVFIEHTPDGPWTVADLSGQPHRSRAWPAWSEGTIHLADPDGWLSTAQITPHGRDRLLRPRLLLASLYHPEHFPLPRFPLAISDLARAARATLLGRVDLMDMQLGDTLGVC
jgi:hypothetical protein